MLGAQEWVLSNLLITTSIQSLGCDVVRFFYLSEPPFLDAHRGATLSLWFPHLVL